jgi:ABC-type branched-subunit amino acid transport system ATPase component
MTALLTIDSISKRFRGLLAVDNVSFRVAQSSIFAVIGPNGAGKTTLFNIIAGALAPDRKRLEVARALATDPKLLLLDEVMAGLRPAETDRMVAILTRLNRETGLTILLIEHVMRAVMALAGRVLVLHHGAAIAEGVPDAVVRDPAVVQSYLGAEAVE